MSAKSDTPASRHTSPGTAASGGQGAISSSGTEIEDVQGWEDTRRIVIDWVGVRDVRHPLVIRDRSDKAHGVTATVGMFVGLPAERKGTHMSRFIELLGEITEGDGDGEITMASFRTLLRTMVERLDADSGRIELEFVMFVPKAAPVSGVVSLCDYEVTMRGDIIDGQIDARIEVVVPVTSLCPCSKEISDYGAHNQRSHVTVSAQTEGIFWIEELVEMIEAQASSEVYGVLKRADEKFVTERAYDNPKFVEDIVRDVAGALNADDRVTAYTVTCENFESIHNHSAWARITG